jgi:methyl-accepting chemotaxis protein
VFFRRSVPARNLDSLVAEAIFHKSPDAMLLIRNGTFVAANPASAKLYRVPVDRILGATPVDFAAPRAAQRSPYARNGGNAPARSHSEGLLTL